MLGGIARGEVPVRERTRAAVAPGDGHDDPRMRLPHLGGSCGRPPSMVSAVSGGRKRRTQPVGCPRATPRRIRLTSETCRPMARPVPPSSDGPPPSARERQPVQIPRYRPSPTNSGLGRFRVHSGVWTHHGRRALIEVSAPRPRDRFACGARPGVLHISRAPADLVSSAACAAGVTWAGLLARFPRGGQGVHSRGHQPHAGPPPHPEECGGGLRLWRRRDEVHESRGWDTPVAYRGVPSAQARSSDPTNAVRHGHELIEP